VESTSNVTKEGSEDVLALMDEAVVVATSRLAYPEAVAALVRRRREGHLTAAALARSTEALQSQRDALLTVDLDEDAGVGLSLQHALRAADCVHLAAALELAAESQGSDLIFACYDRRLNQAARAEGLRVFGPS
jgi:predicted nucleic acid-binding protein